MKLISNRIRSSQSDADKAQRADTPEPLVGRPQPSPAGLEDAQDMLRHGEEGRASDRAREEQRDPGEGSNTLGRDGALRQTYSRGAPLASTAEESAPSSSSGSSDALPPEDTSSPVVTHPVSPQAASHHEITWLMLRLLSAHGKVKAADGSDVLVTFIGEEPPLGDVFQIEATSADMEQRNMTVVVLANESSIEVLGGQEVIVIDSAPFQIQRQPITTSQDVAEAMFDVVEIELRRMGQILLEAVRDVWHNEGGQKEGD